MQDSEKVEKVVSEKPVQRPVGKGAPGVLTREKVIEIVDAYGSCRYFFRLILWYYRHSVTTEIK